MKTNNQLIWKVLAVAFVNILAVLLIDYIDRKLVDFNLYDIERYTVGILIFGWSMGYSIFACFRKDKMTDFIAIGLFVSVFLVSSVLECRILFFLVGHSLLSSYLVGYIMASLILGNLYLAYKTLVAADAWLAKH